MVAGSQCVVAIECSGKAECEMIAVESVTPEQEPEKLLEHLSKAVSQPSSGLTITVYGICGGIQGKSQQASAQV